MRLKEFNEKIRLIDGEQFIEESVNPILYGIKRSMFEQQKLQRLIDEASKTTNSRLAKNRLAKWKRLLDRARQTQERFERLRQEAQERSKAPGQAPETQAFAAPANATDNQASVVTG